MRRVTLLARFLVVVALAVSAFVQATPVVAKSQNQLKHLTSIAGTVCSGSHNYDWALQFTSVGSTGHYYHPGDCYSLSDFYGGWVGINSRILAPSHFPLLDVPATSHSLGWVGIQFTDGSWIQIGWIAGCVTNQPSCPTGSNGCYSDVNFPAVCYQSSLGLYDEEFKAKDICSFNCYSAHDDGGLAYNDSEIYEVYYVGSGCWRVNRSYNVQVNGSPFCGFPGSGAAIATGEVADATNQSFNVEMPYTTFGFANAGTNYTLRIKGANGWVDWGATQSTGSTSSYDEAACPYIYCPNSKPYYLAQVKANYDLQTHGGT